MGLVLRYVINPTSEGKIQGHECIYFKNKNEIHRRQTYIPEQVFHLINYSTVTFLWQKCFLFNNFELNSTLIKSEANVKKY